HRFCLGGSVAFESILKDRKPDAGVASMVARHERLKPTDALLLHDTIFRLIWRFAVVLLYYSPQSAAKRNSPIKAFKFDTLRHFA
ncbi:MAG: hypothetical protein KDI64_21830, partial [Candidatus Accumulibacter sp.]|nr:hypothetical protein [Accumulibacter sp.]